MFLSGENTLAIRFDALHRAFGGRATFRLLPQIVCWLRMTARLLRPISLPLRAKVFSLRIAGEKRGILAEKWGRKQEKLPLFRCLSPVFPIATPPLLSQPVFFRPAPPTDGIDVVAELCSPLRIEQLPGRFALDTRRTRIIRGHIDRLLRRRETKTPPVYENRPRAGIGMCRHRSRNCRATAQRLPLRLPKNPVNPRRRRNSL